MTTPAINPNLTPTTYSAIKPGDRVINGHLRPTRKDAHLLARPVAEVIETGRHVGWVRNWTLPRAERLTRPRNGFTYYDYETVVWRDASGCVFEDRADETVYIVRPA